MSQNLKTIILRETNSLKVELKCTICLDLYTEPVTLTTCQHTFCLDCFKQLFSNKANLEAIGCPICKRLINRRAYYLNEHLAVTIELVKMYSKLLKSLDQEESDKDEMYDRTNRIKKFLDDCVMYKGTGIFECISLSSSSDETDSILMKKENSPKSKVSKALVRKTKSLNCTKIKGKYPIQRRTAENANINDLIEIDEYESPDVCELEEEENKIVKLLEDDCLRNLENEFQNINKVEEQNNESKDVKYEKINQKQKRKHESNFNWNSKSGESNSSIKTAISTGWSRMKTMKKQIKKKEVKYKQLNVSTEISKSKSKSPQDKNTKSLNLIQDPKVVLYRLDSETDSSLNKHTSKLADTSTHIKIENISTEKLDLLLQCIEEDKLKNQDYEDDLYEISTQKLQSPAQENLDEIRIRFAENTSNTSAESIKFKNDGECTIEKFIADVQVHHSSTPVKINKENEIEEVNVEKNCRKQSIKENICDIRDTIINATESSNVNKNNEIFINKKLSEETDVDFISATERTPISTSGTITRRSLRSTTKRMSDEHKPAVENKIFPKRRKATKYPSNKIVDLTLDENVPNIQQENKATLIEGKQGEAISSQDKITNKNSKVENIISEKENAVKRQEVKNELKLFSVQEPIVMNALQSSINAINVVLSQCSNYVKSQSLFSDSCPSKGSKKSNIAERKGKSMDQLNRFLSLPLESNSHSSVNFYGTAIPCLKNIENFYNQIISLSQQISTETDNFKNIINYTNEECESLVISFKTTSTTNVETQTDNITCPKCSSVIKFNSTDQVTPVEEITVLDGFKEINNIDNICNDFANENKSQINQDESSISSCFIQNPSTISKENSIKSSESDLFHTKKVNRQLTFSNETNDSQRRKFKRIRSPTPDSDSESVKSKKSNTNYSKLLYRNDIDIFFQSEQSQKNLNFSLSSQTNDQQMKSITKKYEKNIQTVNEELCTPVNSEDSTSKYTSFLEREYKDAQFDKNLKVQQPVEKQTFDTAPNTVLDNLLGSINLSVFENDNFERDNKNTDKKTQLSASLFTEIEQRTSTCEKKMDSVPDVQSASMFLNTEKEVPKNNDVDKTRSIEKLHLDIVSKRLAHEDADDKEMDKEVEYLTTHIYMVNDSVGSDKDLFGEDNIVESTPQKGLENKRRKINFEFPEQLPVPILDILEPPQTVTENLEWIDIFPPPPPEFQYTEKVEESNLNVQNVSSVTPDIFALNPLDKGFFANSIFLSDTSNKTKELTQRDDKKEFVDLENIIPNSISQEKEIIRDNKENSIPKKKCNIPSTPESSNWRTVKGNLNPIVLAQKEKFSPLQIIVNPNPPKTKISSTPKHQKSILSYIQTPHKETNANEMNKNVSRSCTPLKQSVNSKSNTFVPVKENLQIEVCESPVPQNHLPSTSFMKEKKVTTSLNENNSNILKKSKYNYCITYTRVKKEEMIAINSLTQKLNAKVSKEFDKNITHLIVSVDNQNKIKDHTIKYVLAIAHSAWILSFAWVRDSIQHNQFLPEEPYEVLDVCGIPGPKISRLKRLSNPLLKNFVFCCIDPFISANRADFERVIVNLGGEIRKSSSELANSFGKYCLILVEAKDTQNYDQYQVWRDTLNVLVVDVEWLSRTVGQYQIISVRPYIYCLENGIDDLGYPLALIAPVPETPSQMTMTNTNH